MALCSGIILRSFLPKSLEERESHHGTHVGTTVNSRQPLTRAQTWSSPPRRHLSRCPQDDRLKKDETQDSPFLAPTQQWYPFSGLVWSVVRERKLGSNLLFSSALDTDSKEARPSGSTLEISHVSPTCAPDLRAGFPARPKAMCGKQDSQSDGWARKSQRHTPRPDRVHSRREEGHAASRCPKSQSRGHTEPEGHSQVR